MTPTLIPVKSYLGKFYTELLYSSTQDKYKDSKLDRIFDQRFSFQDNKAGMVIDPLLQGLEVYVEGNCIYVSKRLHEHPSIEVVNSMEQDLLRNPRSLYQAETFATMAYLVCQNHTTFRLLGQVDEPIYVRYKSEFEKFYSSVVVFDVHPGVDVEIVEEVNSNAALTSVVNYVLHPNSSTKLSTFYHNNIAASSFLYRNVIAQTGSYFNHMVFGKGSSLVLDETKIKADAGCKLEVYGVVNSPDHNFNSVLYIEPVSEKFTIDVDFRLVVNTLSEVSYFPAILGFVPENNGAKISVTSLSVDDIKHKPASRELPEFISDITSIAVLDRMAGSERFYNNKLKFLSF